MVRRWISEQLEYTFQQSAQPKRHKKPSGRLSSHHWARRGVDPAVRAARYSADRAVFFEKANKETLVITAIEGTEGIKNLPEILRVKGIDVLFVGPYDLSQSLGVIGQVRHPKVMEKIQEIVTLSKKSGVAVGLYTDTPEVAKEWVKQGILYCCLGIDAAIFYNASSNLLREAHS